MRRFWIKISYIFFLLFGVWFVYFVPTARADRLGQQPTVSVPTVTGTPPGPQLRVNNDNRLVNVWNGPGSDYARIGIMVAGQRAPVLGKSSDGFWLQVFYPGVPGNVGWVYAPLVTLFRGSSVTVVDAPPTPTPLVTPTLGATLEAEFITSIPEVRLPTFTPPPPLVVPTLPPASNPTTASSFPTGLVIFSLGVIGILGALLSLLRR